VLGVPARDRRPWLRWVIGAAVAVVVLAIAVPFVFFHFIEGSAPAKLSLSASAAPSAGASSGAAGGSAAGSWSVGSGSQVGYRVQEILAGQSHTAVGRSSAVTGHLVITGTTAETAGFTVPMSTIHTDSSQRDSQFDGRVMDVATYPTGTFTLTKPIDLAPLPTIGTVRTYAAAGTLTLHGQTRPVTFSLQAERTAAGLQVAGSIPVLFSRWDIPNPSFTGFVTTQNHGILEFKLSFRRA
jgi:polyisoprenoid-binding protein YceI